MTARPKKNRPKTDRSERPSRSDEKSAARGRYTLLAVCGLLLLAVAVVFGQTVRHEFINYDDDEYVYRNPLVTGGLSASSVVAAFTVRFAGNWHPLTWLSHMLDWQLYGRWAGGHHLTSVLLHATTAVILLLVLRRMTAQTWPSAFVAAVFAIHPLHVESVAWAAERKDILSGFFFTLTLAAYAHYVAKPSSWARFVAVAVCYGLGLMAKPMAVTLPFLLLLLDYWPLGRMTNRSILPRLVLEKLPLLLLAAASCLVTLWAQQITILPIERLSFFWRGANAMVSYITYVADMFYPAGLAAFYPHLGKNLPLWQAVAALLALVAITAAAVILGRRWAPPLVGWLWYLGMLVPVIGLVQVGGQARADRYTYLTQIGLYLAVAWAVVAAARRTGEGVSPIRADAKTGTAPSVQCRVLAWSGASLILIALMGCAWRQTTFWRDSETLWTHTLACTSRNSVAHTNLGIALAERGEVEAAISHYRKALEIQPNHHETHNNLGAALAGQGRIDEAVVEFENALKIKPDYAAARQNLAMALADRERIRRAPVAPPATGPP